MFLLTALEAQQVQTGKRISGNKYINIIGTYTGSGQGIGVGFDKIIDNNIIINASVQTEFGKFSHSKYRNYFATIGVSYSYKLVNNLYLEGRGEGFVGLENENDEVVNYNGFYAGFIFSPELEYYISNRTSISVMYNQNINIASKHGLISNAVGIKLNRKL